LCFAPDLVSFCGFYGVGGFRVAAFVAYVMGPKTWLYSLKTRARSKRKAISSKILVNEIKVFNGSTPV